MRSSILTYILAVLTPIGMVLGLTLAFIIAVVEVALELNNRRSKRNKS
jgi:hypothetical protein